MKYKIPARLELNINGTKLKLDIEITNVLYKRNKGNHHFFNVGFENEMTITEKEFEMLNKLLHELEDNKKQLLIFNNES